MFLELARHAGVSEARTVRAIDGDLKETPLPELGGLSYRSFAETIGHDWGRHTAVPSGTLWSSIAARKTALSICRGGRAVIDDLRYPNEAAMVRAFGGIVIGVVRPEANGGITPKWQSEGHLVMSDCDMWLNNEGTLQDLKELVRLVLAE